MRPGAGGGGIIAAGESCNKSVGFARRIFR